MVFYEAAASALLLLFPHQGVSGHGYLKSPRSRQFVAFEDGRGWPILASNPLPEYDPQSSNIGGTEAQCGIVQGERNYDLPSNHVGGLMHANQQACYRPGQVIDVEVWLTAHHMGHYEFHACPIKHGEVPTQACFDAYPMEFISETALPDRVAPELAHPDPNYPTRAYIPPEDYHTSYKYRLPADLAGDLVLIQWYYLTANSCSGEGYDQYEFPAPDWCISQCRAQCQAEIPPDGRGVPEQFWNCAEVRISEDCDGTTAAPVPAPPPPPETTTAATGATAATTAATDSGGGAGGGAGGCVAIPQDQLPEGSWASTDLECAPCDTVVAWYPCNTPTLPDYPSALCDCSGDGPVSPPTPVPPTPPNPPSPSTPSAPSDGGYTADHGEDSRLIAYVGNWQPCPTAEQVDAYSHIVVAFSVSYAYAAGGNTCDPECKIAGDVPLCNNGAKQDLIDEWRAKGKKVILSFGGAGMGGSWNGDYNNCWDYCFGREEAVADQLVEIVDAQNFDGIDIDYEYCYDVGDKQAGRCSQRTALYSDIKAQTFLDEITHKLRIKMDALQDRNGYGRGRYEITHAPMDTDLLPSTEYFRILRDRRADLDFLMPQFYNGVTRPAYGVEKSWDGQASGAEMFRSLSNDMFDGEPTKVVFGHCISDCPGTGSNINAAQAVQVTADLKAVYDGEFACNGGAFFWVALDDVGGEWSDPVMAEVRKTAGCSHNNDDKEVSAPCDDGSSGSCKSQCYAKCRGRGSDVQTNQCWGTPRYIQCDCVDGSAHTFPSCPCRNDMCSSKISQG